MVVRHQHLDEKQKYQRGAEEPRHERRSDGDGEPHAPMAGENRARAAEPREEHHERGEIEGEIPEAAPCPPAPWCA